MVAISEVYHSPRGDTIPSQGNPTAETKDPNLSLIHI